MKRHATKIPPQLDINPGDCFLAVSKCKYPRVLVQFVGFNSACDMVSGYKHPNTWYAAVKVFSRDRSQSSGPYWLRCERLLDEKQFKRAGSVQPLPHAVPA
jgi:hypothetical protein